MICLVQTAAVTINNKVLHVLTDTIYKLVTMYLNPNFVEIHIMENLTQENLAIFLIVSSIVIGTVFLLFYHWGKNSERKALKDKVNSFKEEQLKIAEEYDNWVLSQEGKLNEKSIVAEGNAQKIRDAAEEHYQRVQEEAEKLIQNTRRDCKHKFSNAVDFAFDFEKIYKSQNYIANKEIQDVLDDTYEYKVKTLLKNVSLKNHSNKLLEITNEREKYKTLVSKNKFFEIKDRSNWKSVLEKFNSRLNELQLIQDEREAQAEIKRHIAEEKSRQKELDQKQFEAEEQERILEEKRLAIEEALETATAELKGELEQQRLDLEQQILDTHKQYERAKSMAQLTRQGHVYVISNIGSFGKNVFKIGMTRRLEPLDRVKELGDASVPFSFDVHAMINCKDAPKLEKALHEELEKFRVNKINLRKEFFNVDIESIIEMVEKHHGEVEYLANPEALQYIQTMEIEDNDLNEVA